MLFFIIIIITLFLFGLLIVVPWSFNPRYIPQYQNYLLGLLFTPFWHLRLALCHIFFRFKTVTADIGCHKLSFNSNIDMKQVTEYISLPTRSNRSFYFFVGFVYPLLPLDLTSNKSDSWNRIYACFNQILNRNKIVSRSESITKRYAKEFVNQIEDHSNLSDERLRYILCSIMWELVFDVEPQESDVEIIVNLTESISRCFTYNIDPDWSNRIDLCKKFLKQIEQYPDIARLKDDFHLTTQEFCTVIAMEFFITPALEIGEVLSNLMTELRNASIDLKRKLATDSNAMRYAILTTAHHYPVLQAIFREISYETNDNKLTPCRRFFSDSHTVEIQTQSIAQSIKNESIICENINRFISNKTEEETLVSDSNTCMAFGKGPRICKGKELAIRIINSFLSTIYLELDRCPNIDISSGRKCTPFRSIDDRLYYFNRRCWIADVQYLSDKICQRYNLERFSCHL